MYGFDLPHIQTQGNSNEYPLIDKNGLRYREFRSAKTGGVAYIEYEPTISLYGIDVPVSQADTFRERMKRTKETQEKPSQAP